MTTPEQKRHYSAFDEVVSQAKETLRRENVHKPTLIVRGSAREVIGTLPPLPEAHATKIEYMSFLGRQTAGSGRIGKLQQVFFASSGSLWEEEETIYMDFSPSSDNIHKEVLFVSGVDLLGYKKHLALLEVSRGSDEQVAKLSDITLSLHQPTPLETPLEDAFIAGFKIASLFRVK